MNRVTIAAALVTCAIAVPAGWRPLDADIQSDGPALRPPASELDLGDAKISLVLDRGIMQAGGKASVTLVATADQAHRVTVQLKALQDMGWGAERVQNPPREVDRRTITLDAQPGGGAPVVETFQLAKSVKKPGRYDWFAIVASSPKAKDAAASVDVVTWSGNAFAMTIEPPAAMPTEGPFTVAVRIKNTTKKAMNPADVQLGGRLAGVEDLGGGINITATDDFQVEEVKPSEARGPEDQEGETKIAPGAEYLQLFRIVPRFGVDHFTLVAHGTSYETGAALATVSFDRPKTDDEAPAPTVISRQ